jgi:transposase-like protein
VPKPYPREFRDDIVRVARRRDPGVTLEQIAADFGVHPMTLTKWLRQAKVDNGGRAYAIATSLSLGCTAGRPSEDVAQVASAVSPLPHRHAARRRSAHRGE